MLENVPLVAVKLYALTDPVTDVKSNAIQSLVTQFKDEADAGRDWTVADIADHGKIGGFGARIVGSPEEVADQLQAWVEDTDLDGFNLAYAITPGTFQDIVRWVIPELQRRGVYPTEYADGTLREKLHGRGAHLPAEHRGATYKI